MISNLSKKERKKQEKNKIKELPIRSYGVASPEEVADIYVPLIYIGK